MPQPTRRTLHFGPFEPPPYRIGQVVTCAVRGPVRIVGVSSGRIPWPLGLRIPKAPGRRPSLVIYGALVDALSRESATAVSHWWNISPPRVSAWRRALGIKRPTDGETLLRKRPGSQTAAVEAARKVNRGRKISPETRQRMIAARKLVKNKNAWQPWEDALVRRFTIKEVVAKTGRTVNAVCGRRQKLGVAPRTLKPMGRS